MHLLKCDKNLGRALPFPPHLDKIQKNSSFFFVRPSLTGHFIGQDIVDEMDEIAPMLAKMGYDPDANPPNYGVPDGIVANNTKEVRFAPLSNN